MYIIACDVNTFAKSLWSAVNNLAFDDVCKGIYVTTRPRSFIYCRINQGRTGNWKRDFLTECVFFNNILIQILRFAYFPVTNSKGENSFHRHFNELEKRISGFSRISSQLAIYEEVENWKCFENCAPHEGREYLTTISDSLSCAGVIS